MAKRTKEQDIFEMFVGQEGPKRKLNYLYSLWQGGGTFKNLIFIAAKGCGKTAFATQLGESMVGHDRGREFVVETCSGYKNMEQFMNAVIMPKVHGKRVTVLLDECHLLPQDVQTALLTMLAPNKDKRNTFAWSEYEIEIDFRNQTFLFATTEPHKVITPLKDRLTEVTLQPYSDKHLAQILTNTLEGLKFDTEVLVEISTSLRGNPRQAVMMAEDVYNHCVAHKTKKFDRKHWNVLRKNLDILPLGLTHVEAKALVEMREAKDMSLTTLASRLDMTATAVRSGIEIYLLKKRLMEVRTAGRSLTAKGIQYLENHASEIAQ
jgi:Holliday junction resolvasome RuvABC ATP-dependent DNA helicase subunit